MICRRRLIPIFVCALLWAGLAQADMTPVWKLESECPSSQWMNDVTEVRQTNRSGLLDRATIDFGFGSAQLPSDNVTDIAPPVNVPQYAMDLTGGPGSVNLCLYALMGLGLYSAPHWIKRLHFGHLPEWYHDGGPFQIGHSFAATPESLCTLQVSFLIPPVVKPEDILPQYRLRAMMACWRKSQFTPEVIASRGPPLCS